jgi:hypothetical protein
VAGRDLQGAERHVQDAGIRLGVATALRGHDGLEQRPETGRGEARPLHTIDAVRHEPEAVAAAQPLEDGPASGETVAALREVVEVGLSEPASQPRVASRRHEQAPEALTRQVLLGRLAPAKGRPQVVVDPTVCGDGRRRARQAQLGEGLAERGALGLVEVEQGVVDVEEYGVEAGQKTTWPGM